MVAARDLAPDVGAFDLVLQPVGDDKIVDAPSGVVLPGIEAIAPPGVCAGLIRIEIPEGIRKAAKYVPSSSPPKSLMRKNWLSKYT